MNSASAEEDHLCFRSSFVSILWSPRCLKELKYLDNLDVKYVISKLYNIFISGSNFPDACLLGGTSYISCFIVYIRLSSLILQKALLTWELVCRPPWLDSSSCLQRPCCLPLAAQRTYKELSKFALLKGSLTRMSWAKVILLET